MTKRCGWSTPENHTWRGCIIVIINQVQISSLVFQRPKLSKWRYHYITLLCLPQAAGRLTPSISHKIAALFMLFPFCFSLFILRPFIYLLTFPHNHFSSLNLFSHFSINPRTKSELSDTRTSKTRHKHSKMERLPTEVLDNVRSLQVIAQIGFGTD